MEDVAAYWGTAAPLPELFPKDSGARKMKAIEPGPPP